MTNEGQLAPNVTSGRVTVPVVCVLHMTMTTTRTFLSWTLVLLHISTNDTIYLSDRPNHGIGYSCQESSSMYGLINAFCRVFFRV